MQTLARLLLITAALCFLSSAPVRSFAVAPEKPNIIFIMADDLGYGDLGCYGQKKIQTPRIDQMAADGMKFTQMYAGSTVCAPSRCVLMTGRHMGHTRVRGNTWVKENQSLKDKDFTVAELLKKAGYTTALTGKWGIGEEGTAGVPNKQGFDYFYGYLNQHNAHNYYPEFLWKNDKKVALRNVVDPSTISKGPTGKDRLGGVATKKVDYSHDLILEEALGFIDRSAQNPFFLYVALTIPHANNEAGRKVGDGQEVPDYGIYNEKDWTKQNKGQAAMITRMDTGVGQILDRLKALNIDQNTLVIFTSDNGHHREGGNDPEFFDANGPLRGMKRDLYEGGVRVPFIAYWPGTTPAGSVSDHIGYFGDLMATAADLADVPCPEGLDSVSIAPTLEGKPDQQKEHDFLYWEFYERGGKQAVRWGEWKAVRMPIFKGKTQLFNLEEDLGEGTDLAAKHPDLVKKLEAMMDSAHSSDPLWKPSGKPARKQPAPGDGKQRF
ncbi:arylsulfatase [Gimesia chilikensis]|uniref:arylsulfatase n=1 Tax=Gimesia chilikensis TaxID=2605989 RepID=UPI00118CE8A4|nr:arylsulfatase [Gimesia chilikensis]QDT83674.1 Arylsulfatase [Gimesia chilikensis]